MTNDNQDALRCAKRLERSVRGLERMHEIFGQQEPKNGIADRQRTAAAHLRRLVAHNEAKDALLWQAVETLEPTLSAKLADGTYADKDCKITFAIAAIRQHLEG